MGLRVFLLGLVANVVNRPYGTALTADTLYGPFDIHGSFRHVVGFMFRCFEVSCRFQLDYKSN